MRLEIEVNGRPLKRQVTGTMYPTNGTEQDMSLIIDPFKVGRQTVTIHGTATPREPTGSILDILDLRRIVRDVPEKPRRDNAISVRHGAIHIRGNFDAMNNYQFAAVRRQIEKDILERVQRNDTVTMHVEQAYGLITPRATRVLEILMNIRHSGRILATRAIGHNKDIGAIFAMAGTPGNRTIYGGASYELSGDCREDLIKSGFKWDENNPIAKIVAAEKLGQIISAQDAIRFGMADRIRTGV
jgi:hypothetical protein